MKIPIWLKHLFFIFLGFAYFLFVIVLPKLGVPRWIVGILFTIGLGVISYTERRSAQWFNWVAMVLFVILGWIAIYRWL